MDGSTLWLFVAVKNPQDFSDSDLFHFLYLSCSGKNPNMEIMSDLAQVLKM